MNCANLLADLITSDHSPAVTRQAIRCAKLIFNLVDLHKVKSPPTIEHSKASPSDFIMATLLKIGQQVSNCETPTDFF